MTRSSSKIRTGWHRKHAVGVLRAKVPRVDKPKPRERRYSATTKQVALWEAATAQIVYEPRTREGSVSFHSGGQQMTSTTNGAKLGAVQIDVSH